MKTAEFVKIARESIQATQTLSIEIRAFDSGDYLIANRASLETGYPHVKGQLS
jgi:hypothetical protein